ncbi:flagellar basal body rod protein FlgC [Paraferrimonas sp. SM1919]|uniref:flagellar basal body rod protein FlgC n=1 Tax=Paraferrimonas sp. SM1919 TaxID=2662263 RepID=UPI0013D57DEF|nr:flagellar basal body rod protein FlgC [Paraferrimonas sp. SM1919]
MSLYNIFGISGSGSNAQNIRLNTTASNIANADTVASSAAEAYKARQPIFGVELNQALNRNHQQPGSKVEVLGIVESDRPAIREYKPGHPLADNEGYIWKSNVNVVEEMANMISASRSYSMNVQLADTAKNMLLQTLKLGK